MSARIVVTDEAVEKAARTYYENLGWDWADMSCDDYPDHEEAKVAILAEHRIALEAAAPLLQVELPTREQIAEAMHNHWSRTHTWRQDCDEDVCIAIFLDRATAVLALLSPEETKMSGER